MRGKHIRREERPSGGLPARLFEWLGALVFSCIFVVVLFTFIFRDIAVSGSSMLPTLPDGGRILISCLYFEPKPGDIVVVDAKATKLEQVLVKRVIAVEGQVINIDFQAGKVYVDGILLEESYCSAPTTRRYDVAFPQTVPPGHVFLMGDNRPASEDSRSSRVGMVDKRALIDRKSVV